MKPLVRRFLGWISGADPQGVGALLLGGAALGALCQTSSVLDKVLAIQKQSKNISDGVDVLKHQSEQISSAIALLAQQLKDGMAFRVVDSSPELKSATASKEQIEKALRRSIPDKPLIGGPSIFLPPEKLQETVELLYRSKSSVQRTSIIQNSLQYQAAPLSHGFPASDLDPKNE